jgi:hypothetical protein
MDSIKNPFSPGAGAPPPELAGRAAILEQARVLIGRLKQKRPEKSMLLTGLRGVGKTVLLNEIERIAEREKCQAIHIEAVENKHLPAMLTPHLRGLLYKLNRHASVGDKTRRGIRVLKSFIEGVKLKYGDFELGIDIDSEKGSADSGDLEVDLPNLFVAVAEAAQERKTVIAILIDEIQYFKSQELSALIMAMHKMQQRQLPLLLIGAGLPIIPRLAGESKSYAERLFSFQDVGPLSETDSAKALQDPVKAVGVKFETKSLTQIFRLTKGYPYFLQEWGYQAWNHAASSPITIQTTRQATKAVLQSLDNNFFRVRFDRLTAAEKRYLRAMAQRGKGPYRTSEIADVLGVKINAVGPMRATLIEKGMIYSPSHGDMAFTVPLFDEFMRRVIPTFSTNK